MSSTVHYFQVIQDIAEPPYDRMSLQRQGELSQALFFGASFKEDAKSTLDFLQDCITHPAKA